MSIEDTAHVPGMRPGKVARSGIEPPPMALLARQSWYPWLIVGVTCTGAFIAQLDASIVQLALPFLAVDFQTSLTAVSWVPLAYLLALAAFLPVFGRLCEMFGRKLLYVGGYLVFTLASALCGLAGDLTWLVAARVLQGIGGAMLAANSIAILVGAAGQSRRARALGYFAAAQAIGLSAGPPIGGLLLSTLGWRWVFWVTLPIGCAAIIAGLLVLPQTTGLAGDRKFDWLGALLLVPAVAGLLLALNQVTAWGLTSPAVIVAAGVTAVLIAVLVWHELRYSAPLVDLRIFRSPIFTCGIGGAVLSAALLYGMFFIMSFGLIRGYHRPVDMAGLRLAVIPIMIGIVAPFSGTIAEKTGPRLLGVAGMAFCIVGLLILSIIATEHQADVVMGAIGLALFGAGLGLFITPNNHRTMNAAPSNLSGEAGALLNLMRVLGSSLGVASASAMLSWQTQVSAGGHSSWAIFEGRPLLEAVESGFAMLIGFAVVAALLSLGRRSRPRP